MQVLRVFGLLCSRTSGPICTHGAHEVCVCLQTDDQQQKYLREVFNLIVKRDDSLCNFLEGGPVWGPDTKIVYRYTHLRWTPVYRTLMARSQALCYALFRVLCRRVGE